MCLSSSHSLLYNFPVMIISLHCIILHMHIQEENNILYDSHTLVCEGPRDIFWIVAFLGYILITQLISVVLAFRTRKVKIKALNDAKYVALIIYITTFIIITMIVCAILLSERLNADGAVFGGLLYIFTTTVLSVLFIPKVLFLVTSSPQTMASLGCSYKPPYIMGTLLP